MNKLLIVMEQLQVELEEKIASRESIYDERSDRWKESEKGEAYLELSERLQEMMDELVDWQAELEEQK